MFQDVAEQKVLGYSEDNRAGPRQKVHVVMCAHPKLRSTCASAQSDQNI